MRLLCSVFLIIIMVAGCHTFSQRPSNLIPQDKYINLLIELQLLKSYQTLRNPDSTKVDSLRKAIFAKYGVDKNQFKKSHFYYEHNIKQQAKRIQEAIKRLNKDRVVKPDTLAQKDSTKKVNNRRDSIPKNIKSHE